MHIYMRVYICIYIYTHMFTSGTSKRYMSVTEQCTTNDRLHYVVNSHMTFHYKSSHDFFFFLMIIPHDILLIFAVFMTLEGITYYK